MDGTNETFSFTGRIRSVRYAVNGIVIMIRGQHNAWVHCVAAIAVFSAAAVCNVTPVEWCLLVFAVAIVIVAEALNTAFEFLCDVASPEFHPLVKNSKDVAAGAVLLSAIASTFVGVIIFLPYFLDFID